MERLEESDVADYLAKNFSVESLPAGLANLIHRNSGGNPLFMVAIVQDMGSKGLIAVDRGRLILTAPLEEVYPGIPETLQQMLEIQLERLSPEELRILQSASVAGERFSVWAVAAMLDASPAFNRGNVRQAGQPAAIHSIRWDSQCRQRSPFGSLRIQTLPLPASSLPKSLRTSSV